jgi:hypothetical protein
MVAMPVPGGSLMEHYWKFCSRHVRQTMNSIDIVSGEISVIRLKISYGIAQLIEQLSLTTSKKLQIIIVFSASIIIPNVSQAQSDFGRFQISTPVWLLGSATPHFYKVDRFTGEIHFCAAYVKSLDPKPPPPMKCAALPAGSYPTYPESTYERFSIQTFISSSGQPYKHVARLDHDTGDVLFCTQYGCYPYMPG